MQSLQFLIDMLTKGRKLHISILDVNGILNTDACSLRFENIIHSKEFCKISKSTEKGFRLCLFCKRLANEKAIKEKKAFSGYCPYGLYEAAAPVVIGDAVFAVVYVGNAIINEAETERRIDKSCLRTGVNKEALFEKKSECEYLDSEDELLGIAEIIADYLKVLYSKEPRISQKNHWLVSALRQYADVACQLNPTLKELSVVYHKNEKYMGRLFKSAIGVSFHEYCLLAKLARAAEMLLKTEYKAIDVALECGFNNIPYFNRAFKKQYGVTPSKYRYENKRS